MANLTKCEIRDLALNKKGLYVVGLIIAKSDPRTIVKRQSGESHSVLSITIRDSKEHFINCTLWGTDHFISNADRAYKMGDTVVLNKPTIVQSNNNQYSPRTTSPFELHLDEIKSFIYRESNENFSTFNQLKHSAIKSTTLSLKLSDFSTQLSTKSMLTDLVVAIQLIEPVQVIQTKNGSKSMRRIYLFDESADTVQFTIWSKNYQERVDNWQAMETILHLVGEFNNFLLFYFCRIQEINKNIYSIRQ